MRLLNLILIAIVLVSVICFAQTIVIKAESDTEADLSKLTAENLANPETWETAFAKDFDIAKIGTDQTKLTAAKTGIKKYLEGSTKATFDFNEVKSLKYEKGSNNIVINGATLPVQEYDPKYMITANKGDSSGYTLQYDQGPKLAQLPGKQIPFDIQPQSNKDNLVLKMAGDKPLLGGKDLVFTGGTGVTVDVQKDGNKLSIKSDKDFSIENVNYKSGTLSVTKNDIGESRNYFGGGFEVKDSKGEIIGKYSPNGNQGNVIHGIKTDGDLAYANFASGKLDYHGIITSNTPNSKWTTVLTEGVKEAPFQSDKAVVSINRKSDNQYTWTAKGEVDVSDSGNYKYHGGEGTTTVFSRNNKDYSFEMANPTQKGFVGKIQMGDNPQNSYSMFKKDGKTDVNLPDKSDITKLGDNTYTFGYRDPKNSKVDWDQKVSSTGIEKQSAPLRASTMPSGAPVVIPQDAPNQKPGANQGGAGHGGSTISDDKEPTPDDSVAVTHKVENQVANAAVLKGTSAIDAARDRLAASHAFSGALTKDMENTPHETRMQNARNALIESLHKAQINANDGLTSGKMTQSEYQYATQATQALYQRVLAQDMPNAWLKDHAPDQLPVTVRPPVAAIATPPTGSIPLS